MTTSVVIAAGGTGGHLLPALAIAAALERAETGIQISFVGTNRELDRALIPAAGYRVHTTSVTPFSRDLRGVLAVGSMLPATVQARRILRAERADAVVGMGGYPSLPVVAGARTLRIPSVIHEQNAIPGLANEAAARMTRNIAVSFEQTVALFHRKPRLVGIPLRDAIARFDRDALRDEALKTFGLDPGRATVLVFGGSLGAVRINDAAVGLAERWRARDDMQMLIATGSAHASSVAGRIGDDPGVRVLPYIERMELAFAAADVAVCRAGASTVHELAVVGMPSILVPFPRARRHEQHANARMLVDAGAAQVLEDADATPDAIERLLDPLIGDPAARAGMALAARGVARPHAAEEMAAWVLSLAGARRG